MPRPLDRGTRLLLGLVLLTVVAAPVARAGVTVGSAWQVRERSLHPGVEHAELVRKGPAPAVVNVARVTPGAEATLRAVLAHDTVAVTADGQDRETTSGMCARVGGTVCVNGDFSLCYSCGQPFGGVVDGGRVLRSFREGHEQLSLVDGALTAQRQDWQGRLVATVGRGGGATTHTLSIDGLNVDPIADGAVAYTRDWGPSTPVVGGGHLRLAAPGPLVPGTLEVTPVDFSTSAETVPLADDVVVSVDGARAAEARSFWEAWSSADGSARRMELVTETTLPATLSIGGHPRLLQDGERLPLDQADPKIADRHPRTLVGWRGDGELLLVTVDGRQPGRSEGMTLAEATDLLLELGATDALNLDGGGSTTFVTRCDKGACVANRPSGGGERPVSVALALVTPGGGKVAAASAAPEPPPGPPPVDAPDPASEPEPVPATPTPPPSPPPAPATASSDTAPPPPADPTPPPEPAVPAPQATSETPADNGRLRADLAATLAGADLGDDRLAPAATTADGPSAPIALVLLAALMLVVTTAAVARVSRRRPGSALGAWPRTAPRRRP